jgi:CheY-like chemotaxis protein
MTYASTQEDDMAEEKTGAGQTASNRNRPFLLVVESDPTVLNYLSTLLRRFGYQTYTAACAEEAVAITAVKVPSLIITAARLNDVDGLEFMKQMKKDPRTAGVPFIALTRSGDMYQEARCFEAGAMDCLAQPVSAEALFRAVQTAVEPTPRKNIRIRTMQPVQVTNVPSDEREGTYTLDLSERGMFVRTGEPAPLNTRLALQIDLSGQKIPVEGAVLYQYQAGRGPYLEPGMGVGFVQISPKDQERIRNFIMSEVTRGIVSGTA